MDLIDLIGHGITVSPNEQFTFYYLYKKEILASWISFLMYLYILGVRVPEVFTKCLFLTQWLFCMFVHDAITLGEQKISRKNAQIFTKLINWRKKHFHQTRVFLLIASCLYRSRRWCWKYFNIYSYPWGTAGNKWAKQLPRIQ